MSDQGDKINVVVSIDFSEEIMARIRDVSPRLNVIQHFPDVPTSAWNEVEILYTVRQFPQPEEAPMLRWIQLNSAGIEHTLSNRIVQAEDVLVTSASGIHTIQMANYCLLMMLAFNFRLPMLNDLQRKSTWPEKSHEIFLSTEIRNHTLGIVGYGSIARELARLAQALGVRVLATKRNVKQPAETPGDYTLEGSGDPEGIIPERLYPGEALATMAAECDYLVITVPLTEQTRHMVNERVLDAMKESAILINVARGGVVDEKALITALSQKKIGGAALDVFEQEPLPSSSPLWQMDNVIISPHSSGDTIDYHEKAADLFIANLQRYLEKKPLYNVLNREAGY